MTLLRFYRTSAVRVEKTVRITRIVDVSRFFEAFICFFFFHDFCFSRKTTRVRRLCRYIAGLLESENKKKIKKTNKTYRLRIQTGRRDNVTMCACVSAYACVCVQRTSRDHVRNTSKSLSENRGLRYESPCSMRRAVKHTVSKIRIRRRRHRTAGIRKCVV